MFRLNLSSQVGICGRTGSGKSSFSLALFRMVDTFEGLYSFIWRASQGLSCSGLSIVSRFCGMSGHIYFRCFSYLSQGKLS